MIRTSNATHRKATAQRGAKRRTGGNLLSKEQKKTNNVLSALNSDNKNASEHYKNVTKLVQYS